ncbi:MAG: nuclear transport factor 2 family protein [Mesorhizobium sp.]|uniref:nuclear transport factor 2 family protein n=1 Tax=unclassified Mesorhizobium TaxID=325217 RepID=UPI000F758F9C|nr:MULTISPECIES: nuclear transport factor 2 family protein [unclassified Mesorhizobium]AZO24302.1 nuclear transport factor 2 family protein [Mesorhizobium sp. M1E.F.Ca.ET.045.02.1.1]RUW33757.1 nuclear transport factor 2 family protein [Mesorhizobium sp. M1E.F.Ca.ET.041.01.1.1]RUW84952.1 nuclear transport factor 2 family protein [Mesorhizobium sp. M1E.F.Ca.ET.063.01.1.1]RWB54791.1 MAG: nuclear transport factor 2 family protein [Mesorhizobium sp.]RWD87192.1 MAG: nuclear transport factor 2 family
MSERRKGIITNCLRNFALVFGFCVAFSGTASADSCADATSGWNLENPPAEDRQAIQDLLSRYAWTIDERNAAAFTALFAEPKSSYYQICSSGDSILKLTLDFGPESPDDLLEQMKIILKKMKTDQLQTRHLVTNTLFDVVDDKTVNTKSIVLVTLQDSHSPAPVLDYSADARASFVKGNDGTWRFQSLTVYADYVVGSVAAKKR